MGTGHLTVDLDALGENWRALDALSAPTVETGATVKANAYGLGSARASRALADAGARTFYVAVAEEGEKVRQALGPGPRIFVFSGHIPGDAEIIRSLDLIPLLNSIEQITTHIEELPGHPFGVQLDSGMNRLGLEHSEWGACRNLVMPFKPQLIMSHLACADEPERPMNAHQLSLFRAMAGELQVPLSLSATAGILLGSAFHFDMTRPGIGLYGGLPFEGGQPVVALSVPVIQTRMLLEREPVGYGNTWRTERPARIATIAAGYADGLIRSGSNRTTLYSQGQACPVVGRISMDLISVDITDLDHIPDRLDVICPEQTIDDLATSLGTIGHEVLTALGGRYARTYETAGV